MKKFFFTMVTLLTMAVTSQAMSYEQARQQALFLADKMAYELNLTEDQYEACYEVNLDYLMGVTGEADLYGDYWYRRNMDLSYILLDWQYQAYLNAAYFYRPLYWANGYWHFGIYSYYPHRNYFYYGRPHFWNVYRGGHSWHSNGGHSWYHGRTYGHVDGQRHDRDTHRGMRDGFNKGDYGRGHDYGKDKGGNRGHANQSSTHSTVGNHGNAGQGNRTEGVRNHGTRQNTTQGGSDVRRDAGTRFGGAQRKSMSEGGVQRSTTVRQSSPETSVMRQSQVRTDAGSTMQRSSSSSVQRSSTPVSSSRSFGSSGATRSSSSSSHMSSGSHGGGSSSHAGGGSHGGRR